ncbi:MAG TPA: NADH-quinone oxidoreductase subunit J [Alphaproteobacteria bacterium]|nr:NADH-quinone oxidoreductase subunit J [Alphaproteobacteria bacterium]HNS44481.1 NADH-quinone oxidoreductase subunit J [Alphaproteobacteria bacterium]
MIGVIAFYLFSFVLVVSALMVVAAKNPVYSVLFLILAFFNAAGLFVLLGAEFIAMLIVIVYVGAVAVLFLFVVMMLDINFRELRSEVISFAPFGLLLAGVLLAELVVLYHSWPMASVAVTGAAAEEVDNTKALGAILYTDYIFPFQMSGLILLVAMIGAIVLTLRHRSGVLRQKVGDQVSIKVSDIVDIQKVPTGAGVDHA